jgi:hypothetical protein
MQNTITLAEIEALRGQFSSVLRMLFVETDQGGRYDLVAITPAGLIVEGFTGKQLARVERTGQRVNSHGLVRCRVTFARDFDYAEGTLAFDGEKTGAVAQVSFFELAGV